MIRWIATCLVAPLLRGVARLDLRAAAARKGQLIMRKNDTLHAKLDGQIRECQATLGHDPTSLHLTHDEIDEWRAQFDGFAIPVSHLAYRGIPIKERA